MVATRCLAYPADWPAKKKSRGCQASLDLSSAHGGLPPRPLAAEADGDETAHGRRQARRAFMRGEPSDAGHEIGRHRHLYDV
jgi:hypothetical protein